MELNQKLTFAKSSRKYVAGVSNYDLPCERNTLRAQDSLSCSTSHCDKNLFENKRFFLIQLQIFNKIYEKFEFFHFLQNFCETSSQISLKFYSYIEKNRLFLNKFYQHDSQSRIDNPRLEEYYAHTANRNPRPLRHISANFLQMSMFD